MILSFRDRAVETLFKEGRHKKFGSVASAALRRLAALNAAVDLEALRVPPSNRLEALRGDRAGQHSIRINDQCRLCFRWVKAGAEDVEIVDYH